MVTYSGASRWFLGGLIPYAPSLKQTWLKVPLTLIEKGGTVQEGVVRQLVLEGKLQTGATICIATTGHAGPTADAWTRVGECFIAITNGHHTVVNHLFLSGDRQSIREQVVEQSWRMLKHFLSTYY
jgi:PncC family amidohydrolase